MVSEKKFSFRMYVGFRLALDQDRSLYVSDEEKHEVRQYRPGQTEGVLVTGGYGSIGSASNQLDHARGISVDESHSI